MKLIGLCVVKNEDDIIGQCLEHAAGICDKVMVLDNDSTDQTWSIIHDLASNNEKIVSVGRTSEPFWCGMRADVYNQFNKDYSRGDWWLYLDADEFLAEDPRPVIKRATEVGADIIDAWQIQFYYTDKDALQWRRGEDGRERHIFQRRRYYSINWKEHRLFRNEPGRPWNPARNNTVPDGLQTVCKTTVLNRHYQYRDPEQITRRLVTRQGLSGTSFAKRIQSTDWRSVVRSTRGLRRHEEGRDWRFSLSGLAYYYRKRAAVKLRGRAKRSLIGRWTSA